MKVSTYKIIEVAYRSRLLFRTDSEYRRCLGVSFETIKDNKANECIEDYYVLLNNECLEQTGLPLRLFVTLYLEASEVDRSEGFDWGDRKQNSSRRKFMRMLFRKVSAPTVTLSKEEEYQRFNTKYSDKGLEAKIYPDGLDNDCTIDLIFLMLLTFDVVKPISAQNKRSRDIDDGTVLKQVQSMIELVKTIRDDMPQIGVLTTPLVFERVLGELDQAQAELESYTPARFWALLSMIDGACRIAASPNQAAEEMIEMVSYRMPGIWVDDKDKGENRFWVFPENLHMAFCYERNGDDTRWRLKPYEFCFYSRRYDDYIDDFCLFCTSKGNIQLINKPMEPLANQEVATLGYSFEEDEEADVFSRIEFEEGYAGVPEWLDWRSFERLPIDDNRYKKYSRVLANLYNDQESMKMQFQNTAPIMTDSINCLIAIDNDYIYISDLPKPEKFELKSDSEECGRYLYEPVYKEKLSRSLLTLEVSEKHPLYVLPRNVNLPKFNDKESIKLFNKIKREFEKYIELFNKSKKRDEIMLFNKIKREFEKYIELFNKSKKQYEKYKKLFEAIDSTEMSDQITIYQTSVNMPKVLCFNRFSCVYELNELMQNLNELMQNLNELMQKLKELMQNLTELMQKLKELMQKQNLKDLKQNLKDLKQNLKDLKQNLNELTQEQEKYRAQILYSWSPMKSKG